MRRRMAIVAGVVVVGLALWFAASALASSDGNTNGKTMRAITVTSTATVKNAPDEALIDVAVSSEASQSSEAAAMSADRMTAVIDALKAAGITKDDIQTTGYSVEPRTKHKGRVTVYVARNEIEVTIRDLSAVGSIIDAAVGAGANEVRNIRFQLSDETKARTDALRQAVRGARQKADVMAAAAGVRVTGVQAIREEQAYSPVYRYEAAALAAPAPSTPVVPPAGIETRVTVTAVFTIG